MDITISPSKLHGSVRAIPSKSQAHRVLICAAFAESETSIVCAETNQDIEATVACLNALGANITRTVNGYHVCPVHALPSSATLPCNESGSTMRFMLPIVGALGVDTLLTMEGRLPQRPLSPLWEEMERMGCCISRPNNSTIRCQGTLRPGKYSISGSVSSQFITGLLFAMALMNGTSQLTLTSQLESKPYVEMTQQALRIFGVNTDNYCVQGNFQFRSPKKVAIEGDWSNAAFFLTAAELGNPISVSQLDDQSFQGDKAIRTLLKHLDSNCTISAADIPDLIPILSVAAASKHGAKFTDIQRLRLKESDRISAIIEMLSEFGIEAYADETTLTVLPGKFRSCTINSHNDHRIAMSAAIAATVADGHVTITNAQCVSKSYPAFWEDYQKLGGNYEQYIW